MVFRGGEQVGQTCPGWGLQELPQEGEGGLTTLGSYGVLWLLCSASGGSAAGAVPALLAALVRIWFSH